MKKGVWLSGVPSSALIGAALVYSSGANAATLQDAPQGQQTPAFQPALPSDKHAPDSASPSPAPQDIIVTGTSIRGIAPTGSETVQVNSKAIDASGKATISQVLATVPQLASFGTHSHPGGVAYPLESPDIRGLGSNATLSLLNNHRLVGTGVINTVSDPTLLPAAAIERIEIVPDGASSIYGSDAVAGVVNVILKKDYSGVDARASYGIASGYAETNGSIVAGKSWGSGSILIGYQYYHNDALVGNDRSYNNANLSSHGGIDSRSLNNSPPNVTIDGVSYAGPGYLPGTTNLYDPSMLNDILPRITRHSVVVNWHQDIGDRVHLFGDGEYLHSFALVSNAQNSAQFVLPNTNPYFRDFSGAGAAEETVNYLFNREFGQRQRATERLETYGASAGVDVDLFNRWRAELVGNYGRSDPKEATRGLNSNALNAAAASSDPATAFDPFGGQTNPSVLATIYDYISDPIGVQTMYQGVGKIDGPLFHLPGGDVRVAIGGEVRHETYSFTSINGPVETATSTVLGQSRDVQSEFGEIFIPIFGPDNAIAGAHKLDISASIRHDHYTRIGGTTNPKFGVSWEPISGIELRGTYGRSFNAPTLAVTNPGDANIEVHPNAVAPGVLTPIGDPTPYNVYLEAGGNPNLKPEKATTYSLGVNLSPAFMPHLHASVTYFNVNYKDRVGQPIGHFFDVPAFAQYVTRNPTPEQLAALIGNTEVRGALFPAGQTDFFEDARPINIGQTKIAGIDYQATYQLPAMDVGQIQLGVGGVTYTRFEDRVAPGTPFINDLDRGNVRWRARGSLEWQKGPVDANFFVNYVGGYDNIGVTPTQKVGAFVTVDANATIDIPARGIASKMQLVVNIENLLDRNPPFYNGGSGYNTTYASPVGRMVTVGVRTKF